MAKSSSVCYRIFLGYFILSYDIYHQSNNYMALHKNIKAFNEVIIAPNSPWGNTLLEWCCSPGWMVTREGSLASSRSMFLSCQKTETRHECWPPAAWSPSFSLWHKRSAFGRWQPLARPCARNSSRSLRRSESVLLQNDDKVTILTGNYITIDNMEKNSCLKIICYLGCNPSFQFWHLGRLDLRCRTSSIVSCLLCLLVETVKKQRNDKKKMMLVSWDLLAFRMSQIHHDDQWSVQWSSGTLSHNLSFLQPQSPRHIQHYLEHQVFGTDVFEAWK